MYIDHDHRHSNLPAEIILFCDSDAALFRAIVKHYSLELDAKIADELEYLPFRRTRTTGTGLFVKYHLFEFYSYSERRLYSIIRFDTLEDAAKFLFSEPYKERGAILICPYSWGPDSYSATSEPAARVVSNAKAFIRTTLGFSCVAVLINDALKLQSHIGGSDVWADEMMDFAENGIVGKGQVVRVVSSAQAMLDARHGGISHRKEWWCPSPKEHLQSMLTFFHGRLPLYFAMDEQYFRAISARFERKSQILTARFYCYHEREGGSRIVPTDRFTFSIAGTTVTEGHIMDAPGLAIEPGKLCEGNVLIRLHKAVVVESRDQFVVRRANGSNIGVGMIVSCS